MFIPLVAVLTGCEPPPYELPGELDDGQPFIEVTYPAAESAVVSCTFLTVNVRNFTLVDPMTNPVNVDGQGHYHVEYPKGASTGYALCTRPYCLVELDTADLGLIPLSAILMDNTHNRILDDNGEAIGETVPVELSAGDCAEGGDTGASY